MAFAYYKPTAAERRAIEAAWRIVEEKCNRYLNEVNRHLREEIRGCGSSSDRVPTLAAKALLIKWFMEGADKPNMLARGLRGRRPAVQFMYMEGASAAMLEEEREALRKITKVHEACFDRHIKKQMEYRHLKKQMESGA